MVSCRKIEYPGIAQLVARQLWECRGGIRDGAMRNAAKPCNTGNSGFSPVAENGTKAALTTGMTTDRKIFDFLPRRDIMAKIEYPGVAQLVGRDIWEQDAPLSSQKIPCPQSLNTPAIQALPPQVEVVKKSP